MPYILVRGNLASYGHKYPWRVLVSGLKAADIEQLSRFSSGGYCDDSTIVYLQHPCVILTALEVLGYKVVASSSTSVKQDYNEYMWTMRKDFSEPEPDTVVKADNSQAAPQIKSKVKSQDKYQDNSKKSQENLIPESSSSSKNLPREERTNSNDATEVENNGNSTILAYSNEPIPSASHQIAGDMLPNRQISSNLQEFTNLLLNQTTLNQYSANCEGIQNVQQVNAKTACGNMPTNKNSTIRNNNLDSETGPQTRSKTKSHNLKLESSSSSMNPPREEQINSSNLINIQEFMNFPMPSQINPSQLSANREVAVENVQQDNTKLASRNTPTIQNNTVISNNLASGSQAKSPVKFQLQRNIHRRKNFPRKLVCNKLKDPCDESPLQREILNEQLKERCAMRKAAEAEYRRKEIELDKCQLEFNAAKIRLIAELSALPTIRSFILERTSN